MNLKRNEAARFEVCEIATHIYIYIYIRTHMSTPLCLCLYGVAQREATPKLHIIMPTSCVGRRPGRRYDDDDEDGADRGGG